MSSLLLVLEVLEVDEIPVVIVVFGGSWIGTITLTAVCVWSCA